MLEHRCHAAHERVEVGFLSAGDKVLQGLYASAQERLDLYDFFDGDPLQAFDKNKQALAGQLDDLVHKGHGANLKEIDGLGVVDPRIALRDDADELLILLQVADQLQRTVPSDGQWQDGIGKQDGVANRKNR